MATGEDEPETIVRQLVVGWLLGRCGAFAFQENDLSREHPFAPEAVQGLVSSRSDDPGTRAPGNTVLGPTLRRNCERLLHRFFGAVEVSEQADEARENASVLL